MRHTLASTGQSLIILAQSTSMKTTHPEMPWRTSEFVPSLAGRLQLRLIYADGAGNMPNGNNDIG